MTLPGLDTMKRFRIGNNSFAFNTVVLDATQRITGLIPTGDVDNIVIAWRGSVTDGDTLQYWARQNDQGTLKIPNTATNIKIEIYDTDSVRFINTSDTFNVVDDQEYNFIVVFDRTSDNSSGVWIDGVSELSNAATSTFKIPVNPFTLFSALSSSQSSPISGTIDFVWVATDVGAITLADLDAALFSGVGGVHEYLGVTGVADGITPDFYRLGDAVAWSDGGTASPVGTCTVTGTFVDQ